MILVALSKRRSVPATYSTTRASLFTSCAHICLKTRSLVQLPRSTALPTTFLSSYARAIPNLLRSFLLFFSFSSSFRLVFLFSCLFISIDPPSQAHSLSAPTALLSYHRAPRAGTASASSSNDNNFTSSSSAVSTEYFLLTYFVTLLNLSSFHIVYILYNCINKLLEITV